MTNKQVCERWATNQNKSAKNGKGSLYCSNGVIYSYGTHFPIAKWVNNDQSLLFAPKPYVKFTTDRYSPTTARHMSMVLRSIPKGVCIKKLVNVLE